MKKCIVINRIPLGAEGQLRRKHMEQVEAFSNMGFDTYYIGYDEDKVYLIHNDERHYVCESNIHGYGSYVSLFKAVNTAISKYGQFDLAYMRMIPATPALIKFLSEIRLSCKKIVYEFPTYPYDMEESKKGINLTHRVANLCDRVCRTQLKKYIDLAIVLTSNVDNVFGIPALFLRNGINVRSYKKREALQTKKTEILCMGKLQKWHGYDRIISGAIDYVKHYKQVPFVIYILGDGDARSELIEQAKAGGLDESIIQFPGIVVGNKLDEYFDRCSFAVESLGLHRLNLEYSSTLKSREYLARGIPFVYSLPIPGITNNLEYCYQVKADESAVNMKELLDWINSLKQDYSEAMRQYAFDHYSWESQFRIICERLQID